MKSTLLILLLVLSNRIFGQEKFDYIMQLKNAPIWNEILVYELQAEIVNDSLRIYNEYLKNNRFEKIDQEHYTLELFARKWHRINLYTEEKIIPIIIYTGDYNSGYAWVINFDVEITERVMLIYNDWDMCFEQW
jgi:hypothetical protein